jgi:hypothetical protein
VNRNDAPATAIHGIRIYLKSVKLHRSRDNTPIYVHGRLSDQWSDLYYIFRPLAERWRGHFLTTDFGIMIGDDCRVVDPLPSLAEQFGKGLLEADVKTQLAILSGDEFPQWGPGCRDAALLPVFVVRPKIEVARDLFWSQTFRLTTRTWPREMRSLLHCWDDIYWQFFSTDRADIDLLIEAHAGDPMLDLYFSDLDREYPNPSNQKLVPVK